MMTMEQIEKNLYRICSQTSNMSSNLTKDKDIANLYHLNLKFIKYNNKTDLTFDILNVLNEDNTINLKLIVNEQDERFWYKCLDGQRFYTPFEFNGFKIDTASYPALDNGGRGNIFLKGDMLGRNKSDHLCFQYLDFITFMEKALICFNEWAISEYFKPKEENFYAIEQNIEKDGTHSINQVKIDNPIINKCYPTSDLVMRLNLSLEVLNELKKASLDLFNTMQEQINDKIEFYKQEYQMLENIKKSIDNKKY